MKIDSRKTTFRYYAPYWSDYKGYNLPGGETGFDGQESKVPTYWNTAFPKICLGMKIGQQLRFIVIHKQADSLFSLIADGQYRATLLGRDKWKELIGSQGSLQYNCEKEGFNVVCSRSGHSKARIGIVSENKNSSFVARATQGSDLAQKGTLTPQTRVVTRPLSIQIMETNT
nr:uncharacterized skeletal organic matrix protein 5-like [Pocillopora verrucosa]